MFEWLQSIGECLRWQPMTVWLGFSFLMRTISGDKYDLVYAYAARELPFAKLKVSDKVSLCVLFNNEFIYQSEWNLFEKMTENRKETDFLHGTFVATQVSITHIIWVINHHYVVWTKLYNRCLNYL